MSQSDINSRTSHGSLGHHCTLSVWLGGMRKQKNDCDRRDRALPRARVPERHRCPDRGFAGLTWRTFSRYFTDKRDVLFAGSERLPGLLAEALNRVDPELTPFEALVTALADVGAVLGAEVALHAVQRRELIARSPELQERGRTRFADVADALAAEMVRRGCELASATLLADVGVAIFERALTGGSTTPIVTTWPLACARPAPSSSTPLRHSATSDQDRRPSEVPEDCQRHLRGRLQMSPASRCMRRVTCRLA